MSRFLSKLTVINPSFRWVLVKLYSNAAQNLGQVPTKVTGAANKSAVAPKTVTKSPTAGACGGQKGSSGGSRGSSAGTPSKCSKSSEKPKQNCGNFIIDKCDVFEVPRPRSRPYRMLSYFMIPLIIAFAVHVLSSTEEKESRYVPYEHMYRHSKRFPWGDGRTTFFHGPFNLIPDEETHRPDQLPQDGPEEDLNRRKALRDQHAKEELERRRARHEQEAAYK